MKLIELYLEEIRRQLPSRNRDDILKEIQSTLMDTIEDRNPNPGQEPDEETIKTVLKEFGAPRQVARQYGAKNYLVGPRMFPVYLRVLRIVLIVVAAFNVVGLIVAVVNHTGFDSGLLEAVLQLVGGLISSLFTAFGVVTLSFLGIERAVPENWKSKIDEDWQPEDLLKEEDHEQVKIFELAIEITGSLIFITLINFFLDKIGIYYLADGRWVSAPLLNDFFLRYIPWITAYNIVDIALDLYLLRLGVWNKTATVIKVLNNAFKIAVTYAIIVGPAVITVDPAAWQKLSFDFTTSAERLTQIANTGFDILMGLTIFGLVVDSIRRLYQSFIKGQTARINIEGK
jgi:hypothetical protein